jgi:glutathione-independent formaldehyde dehydrogenase
MKALVYHGPRDVRVLKVEDPTIERPTDVLVRITSSNICGSDLHMYEGCTDVEKGKVLGHENLGEVIAIGKAVDRIKVGDQVCFTVNPGAAGGAYGYAGMGSYNGGQAEYLRVPYGDFNCLHLPPDAREKESDYVMLADMFPTGYHAANSRTCNRANRSSSMALVRLV